ncbi:unnamed protein product [Durusdinium trenchii]|uniref:Uncharacterized protein n=1 Tax=Durusdinium trenchii TaxID=1381693 RepID=A0ABP0PWX5_9DINO
MAGALTLFAPDCSSWGLPCRGTSMRSFINPEGFESYQFVANANCMVSRMVLCIMLILSRSSYFLVEQPAQSLLYMHKRWQYLVNRVAWVFQVFFWMQLHGAKSPKRSMFMGNLRTMGMLDKGKYVDKTGQQRFTGRAAELKASQAYPRGLGACIRDLYSEQLQGGPHGGKIRELLENNGMQFPVVELQVQKFSTMSKETKKEGKWVTILDDRGTLYKDSNSD